MNLKNNEIRNPIFVYYQEIPTEDNVWEELANYLKVLNILHGSYHGHHIRNRISVIDFCNDEYDAFL